MAIDIPGTTVVFDYGEVVSFSQSPDDRAALTDAAGVDPEAFWAAYHAERDLLDGGELSTGDYWAGIGRACGRDWDLATRQRLWALDIRSWTSADPEVVRVLEELHEGGTRLALLSNAAADYGGLFRFDPIATLFDAVFVSGELRLLKPDPAIYRHVCTELGVEPAAAVFVDNREANVRGAESIGMRGHTYTSPSALRTYLTSLT